MDRNQNESKLVFDWSSFSNLMTPIDFSEIPGKPNESPGTCFGSRDRKTNVREGDFPKKKAFWTIATH